MTNQPNFQSALILGGSCQLALRLFPRLLAENIRPFLTYRNEQGKERILSEAETLNTAVSMIHLDFSEPDTLANLDRHMAQGPDYLVDFIHSDYESLVAGGKPDLIRDYFDAQITVRAMVVKKIARLMLSHRRGRLVYISSTAAVRPNPGQGFYAAAKLAAEALYRSLGLEMASKGITTAILRPGYVTVGRGERYLAANEQVTRKLKKSGQLVLKEDLIEAVLYLLLKAGPGVNGAVLTLDGGMTIGKPAF